MNPTLLRIVVTYQLSPPHEAPEDWDENVEVDTYYDDLRTAILVLGGVGAPAVVPRMIHPNYSRWRTVSARIEAEFVSTGLTIPRVVVASVSEDGWEPNRLDDDTLLDVLGDFGRTIRVGVGVRDAAPLARLYLHSASPSRRSPATCDDCAADDRCQYESLVTILGGFRR